MFSKFFTSFCLLILFLTEKSPLLALEQPLETITSSALVLHPSTGLSYHNEQDDSSPNHSIPAPGSLKKITF